MFALLSGRNVLKRLTIYAQVTLMLMVGRKVDFARVMPQGL